MNNTKKTIQNTTIVIITSIAVALALHYTLAKEQDQDSIQLNEMIDYHTAMGRNTATNGEYITVTNN